MDAFQTVLTLSAFILGMMLWSYAILGDNYAFAFSEATYLAGYAANSTVTLIQTLSAKQFSAAYAGNIVVLVGLILGLTQFTRLTRYRWAARYSTAVMSGAGVGIIFGSNLRTQILNPVIETIDGLAKTVLTPSAFIIQNSVMISYGVPVSVIAVFWLFATVMLLIMVMTFSYSRLIAGPFFNPGSRLAWVSRLGRIFIMIMLGHISCKTLLGDSLDSLILFLQVAVRRTYDAFVTGVSPY